jgi:hypothetical protein
LAHVTKDLARLSIVLLLLCFCLLLEFKVLEAFVVRFKLLLELEDIVRAFLVLFLENCLDTLQLGLVGTGCQLKVLVDIV